MTLTTCDICDNRYTCKLFGLWRTQQPRKPKQFDEVMVAEKAFHEAGAVTEQLLTDKKIEWDELSETMQEHERYLKSLGEYF